jgi:Bacterial Ig domain
MKKIRISLLLACFASLLAASAVFAQTEQLTLRMSRDFGYGGFGNDIEGLFSMHVTGPADLARVEYYIDSTKIGEVTQPPFNLQFNTDNYPLGNHQLYAVGYSSSGQKYSSNVIPANFVPKQSATKFILPVLGVIVAVILLSTLVPLIASRGKRASLPLGAERNYGIRGGAICPKCKRPFALPLFSANLGFYRMATCPFCGKLSLVRTESINNLRAAEKAELEQAKAGEQIIGETEEDKLRKELDDSKYKE